MTAAGISLSLHGNQKAKAREYERAADYISKILAPVEFAAC